MSLQFDGAGIVTIPLWQTTGDFTIAGTFTYNNADEIYLGHTSTTSYFVACISGGTVRARMGATNLNSTGFTAGDVVEFTLTRVGTDVTLAITGKSDVVGTNSDNVNYDVLGKYSSGLLYEGLASGTLTMVGDGGDREYNFNQAPGSLTLPDITSSQDGTLSGFVTGDFNPIESIAITSLTDDQCRQRDGSGNATFTVSGTVSAIATSVESSIDDGASWQLLDAAPTTTYSGTVVINGEASINVRIGNDTGATDVKLRIKAAACIAAWWQSNEAGRGLNSQTITVGGGNPSPSVFKTGVFSLLTDPTGIDGPAAGSMWPRIAQRFSDAGVPVCIANVAAGGTSITSWLSGGANYTKITDFSTACGGLEFTTSVGGETDSSNGMSTVDMVSNLTAACTSLNTDFGTTHYLTYFPVGTSTGTTPNVNNIRAAFDEVIADNAFVKSGGDLSNIDISSGTNGSNDNLHLKLDADLTEGGNIRYMYLANMVGKFTGTLVDWETGSPQASLTGLKAFFASGFGENKINESLLVFDTDANGDFSFEAPGALTPTEYVVGLSNSAGTILEYHKLTAEAI